MLNGRADGAGCALGKCGRIPAARTQRRCTCDNDAHQLTGFLSTYVLGVHACQHRVRVTTRLGRRRPLADVHRHMVGRPSPEICPSLQPARYRADCARTQCSFQRAGQYAVVQARLLDGRRRRQRPRTPARHQPTADGVVRHDAGAERTNEARGRRDVCGNQGTLGRLRRGR